MRKNNNANGKGVFTKIPNPKEYVPHYILYQATITWKCERNHKSERAEGALRKSTGFEERYCIKIDRIRFRLGCSVGGMGNN